jgi:uncharacterized protein with HEPN domain
MSKKRARNLKQEFYISQIEEEFLREKMKEAGIKNKSAYLRKMAMDGYIIHQDYTNLKAVIYELNRIGNNLNQIAKVANTYSEIDTNELKKIESGIDKIWRQLSSMELK